MAYLKPEQQDEQTLNPVLGGGSSVVDTSQPAQMFSKVNNYINQPTTTGAAPVQAAPNQLMAPRQPVTGSSSRYGGSPGWYPDPPKPAPKPIIVNSKPAPKPIIVNPPRHPIVQPTPGRPVMPPQRPTPPQVKPGPAPIRPAPPAQPVPAPVKPMPPREIMPSPIWPGLPRPIQPPWGDMPIWPGPRPPFQPSLPPDYERDYERGFDGFYPLDPIARPRPVAEPWNVKVPNYTPAAPIQKTPEVQARDDMFLQSVRSESDRLNAQRQAAIDYSNNNQAAVQANNANFLESVRQQSTQSNAVRQKSIDDYYAANPDKLHYKLANEALYGKDVW